MKSLLISTVAVLLVACSSAKVEQKVDPAAQEVVEQKVDTAAQEVVERTPAVEMDHADHAKIDRTHFYSGPRLMMVIKAKGELLNLTEEQKKEFEQWRAENHPKSKERAMKIKALEKEIEILSIAKAPLVDLLAKSSEILVLRKELATIKTECQSKLKTALNTEQWKQVVEIYKADHPFNARLEKPVLVSHINPLPNYMGVIKHTESFVLTDAQKENFANWSKENGPKVMALGKKIMELEKTIYDKSLAGETTELSALMDEIGVARTEILTIKTKCRDNLIAQLDEAQWTALVGLVSAK